MRAILLGVFLGLFCSNLEAKDFPDLKGILDFSQPKNISHHLFILTNPKSGSHLLLYSIMKITKRPLRGRLPLVYFLNDPNCYPPENIMNYEIDFSKPTTYWGHEYHLLRPLNRNGNKLIFILRNYKETICSQLLVSHNFYTSEEGKSRLDKLLLDEVLNEGIIFKEYMIRLQVYDEWKKHRRCLVQFEDLTHHPEKFVPQVMSFIGDKSDYSDFVKNYGLFLDSLGARYKLKGNSTGSGTQVRYFSDYISKKTHNLIDNYVKEHYPMLWSKYLREFEEQ